MDRKRPGIRLREAAGFLLLTALLAVGMLSSWLMCRNHDGLSGQMEDAAWFAVSGEWQQARDTAARVRSDWNRFRKVRCAFADHTPMEQIDSLFSQLSVYGAANARTEFASVCAELSEALSAMADAHRPAWWNLF